MKHWQETSAILDRVAELSGAGRRAAVACVVNISGSAYRRPGARFLVVDDGATLGGVSGGCLEEDVRQAGLSLIESGGCRLLHYETGDDEDALWGLGLGCDGEVDVFVTPADRAGFADSVDALRERLRDDDAFAAVTVIGDDDAGASGRPGAVLVLDAGGQVTAGTGDDDLDDRLAGAARAAFEAAASRVVELDGVAAFVEIFEPPPYLVVCGAGDDAMPMVQCAADSGFRVVVVDHRPAYLTADRFPAAYELIDGLPEDDVDVPATADTYVVLKTHNIARDKAWARRLLDAPVPYLGLLGPRARCEEIAEEAGAAGQARLFGPVGLDLGAEGPEQVGIAVVSEILAVRAGRAPGHLKDRDAPIHDPL